MKMLALAALLCIACGPFTPADGRSPQDLVDQASIHLTPDAAPLLAIPAPHSILDVNAQADRGFSVEATVTEISARDRSGNWMQFDPARQSIVQISEQPSLTQVHTFAETPLQFHVKYRAKYEHDGATFYGDFVERAYCVGD